MENRLLHLENEFHKLFEPPLRFDGRFLIYEGSKFDIGKSLGFVKVFSIFSSAPQRIFTLDELRAVLYGIPIAASRRMLDTKRNSIIKIISRARKVAYDELACKDELTILPYDAEAKGWIFYAKKDLFYKRRLLQITRDLEL